MKTLIVFLSVMQAAVGYSGKVRDKQRVERNFAITPQTPYKKIVLDNIAGNITVKGYDGNEIRLVVEEEFMAESDDKLKEARKEVVLEIEEKHDRIILFVDAPWRDKWGHHSRGWDYYGFEARFDFELQVPRSMQLLLKTVNNGDIVVNNIEGDFDFQNVNGSIEVTDIAGSGRMHTVNGPVRSRFTRVPESDCSFYTVNGKIELEFPDGLSADVRFKTFNGSVYTDFEVEGLPRLIKSPEVRKGRKVYHKDASFGVRIGKGGATYVCETLNGNIHILKRNSH